MERHSPPLKSLLCRELTLRGAQIKTGASDLDANLALLRFYQYSPSIAKVDVARKVRHPAPHMDASTRCSVRCCQGEGGARSPPRASADGFRADMLRPGSGTRR